LVVAKFTNWSNFVREAWLIKEKWNKRSCLKPPMNADAHRRSAPLIGVHRRFPTAQPFAAHGLFGVQALACPGQCSLKAELQTCARHDARFDHFANFVRSKRT